MDVFCILYFTARYREATLLMRMEREKREKEKRAARETIVEKQLSERSEDAGSDASQSESESTSFSESDSRLTFVLHCVNKVVETI
jgi:hypothetical protein